MTITITYYNHQPQRPLLRCSPCNLAQISSAPWSPSSVCIARWTRPGGSACALCACCCRSSKPSQGHPQDLPFGPTSSLELGLVSLVPRIVDAPYVAHSSLMLTGAHWCSPHSYPQTRATIQQSQTMQMVLDRRMSFWPGGLTTRVAVHSSQTIYKY